MFPKSTGSSHPAACFFSPKALIGIDILLKGWRMYFPTHLRIRHLSAMLLTEMTEYMSRGIQALEPAR